MLIKLDRSMKHTREVFILTFYLEFCESELTNSLHQNSFLIVSNNRIRKKRPSLRIIVSSATLDATKFLDYFSQGSSPDECTIVSLEGRMYPVEVAYLSEPTADYVQKAAEVVWNINLQVSLHLSHGYISPIYSSF